MNPRRPGLHGSVALALLGFVIGAAQPVQSQTEENSEPTITVSVEGPDEVGEDGSMATLSLRAATAEDRRPTEAVEVHIARGGSATEAADYEVPTLQTSSYVVTLTPEAFTRSSEDSRYVATHELTIYIVDDNEDEPDETIVLTPGDSDAPDNVSFASAYSLTLKDNDEPSITISFEGPSQIDEDGGSITITVRAVTAAALAPHQAIRFQVFIRGTAKPPGVNYLADFESYDFPYYLTLPADAFVLSTDAPRYVATFEFTVTITDDSDDEAEETIELSITYAPFNVTSTAPYTLTILDNDTSLAIANGTAEESEGRMSFAVTKSSPSTNVVTVEYATAAGTATSGTDYTSTSGTLTFPAGAAAPQTIQVPILADSAYEGDETFTVTLTAATNATITTAAATGRIVDDDGVAVRVSFEAASYTADEGSGANVGVTLSAAPGRVVEVPLQATPGNGASADDYELPASVSFTGEETTLSVQLRALADDATEVAETVEISFGTLPAGVSTGIQATATVTLSDPVPVNIPDESLRSALVRTLGKTTGETVYRSEMATILRLSASAEGVTELTGLEAAVNLTSLALNENQIANLTALASLTSLEYLSLHSNQIADITSLARLQSLDHLDLRYNTVSNLSPLARLTSLRQLKLGNNEIQDLLPLGGLIALEYLGLNDNQIANIANLAGLTSITRLELADNQIVNISALAGLTLTEHLELPSNRIADITPLAGLTSLEFLSLDRNEVTDLAPVAGLVSLEYLTIPDNRIVSVGPLAGLNSLRFLKLHRNQIVDISPLGSLSLETLLMRDNSLTDITPLAGMTSLEHLNLAGHGIVDIGSLASLTSLLYLELTDNAIVDLTPLSGMTSLQDLGLSGNRIVDIGPLEGLRDLLYLFLTDNRITDVTPLSGLGSLRLLFLGDNRIADFSPLDGLTNVTIYGKEYQSAD